MTRWLWLALVPVALTLPAQVNAQTAAPAPSTMSAASPAAVSATCKDGTSFSGTTLRGACRGHGGVAKGSAASSSTAATPAATPAATSGAAAAATTTPPATGSSATAPVPTTAAKRKPPQPAATAKPGGGPGLVWTNPDSKVYHCYGSRWYGRTKQGDYMSETAAKSAGFHAAQNKACSGTS